MSMILKQIYMFDMDGTLLDLAYDDLIWNIKVPQHYAETYAASMSDINLLMRDYEQYKHTLAWYST